MSRHRDGDEDERRDRGDGVEVQRYGVGMGDKKHGEPAVRTITVSEADLAALIAIRPVIADANLHPGRADAIAALDRIVQKAAGPEAAPRASRFVPDTLLRVQACVQFDFERFEILREELEGRYRVSAMRGGQFAFTNVTDRALDMAVDQGTPSFAWWPALWELAAQLGVPDVDARLRSLIALGW
jgi:hypothetical protein